MGLDAVKYYRHLFKIPSLSVILAEHVILGLASGLYMGGLNLECILKGFLTFTVTSLLSDLITRFLCRSEQLLTFRRMSGLTLFSNLAVVVSSLLFTPLKYLGFSMDRILLIGFPLSVALRFMVFKTLAFEKSYGLLSMIQPLTCLLTLIYVYDLTVHPTLPIALSVTLLTTHVYLSLVDKEAKSITGFNGLTLFRAFLADWMENLDEPIENVLEELGVESEHSVDILVFKTSNSRTAIVVPYIHPGPFKNVGSSSLPWSIQSSTEKLFKCEAVAVPHGVSTHAYNLTSKKYIPKVLEALSSLKPEFNMSKSSKPVRVSSGPAQAICQSFNGVALLALTLAPNPMEDIPPKIKTMLEDYGRSLGFKSVIVVDAHNSFSWNVHSMDDSVAEALVEAGKMALHMASKAELNRFKLGFSRRYIYGYGVKDGIGPGGLVLHLFMVEGSLYAYVTIDGNNMVSGLREKIVQKLKEMGVSDVEVFTTDTHMVNATVLNRGYNPVGEVVDEKSIIQSVLDAFKEAYSRLEWASVYYGEVTVSGLKVLGDGLSKLLESLESSVKKAKRLAFNLMTPLLMASMLMMVL
jgi:putative membrane protein